MENKAIAKAPKSAVKTPKSTAFRDGALLTLITFVAALLLGYVYEITKGPIIDMQAQTKINAYQKVYEDLSQTESLDELTARAAAFTGYEGITIDEVLFAKDAAGEVTGLLLTVTTSHGYNGTITFAMGYKLDGTMTGIEFLTLTETAGLGMNAKKDSFKEQFSGQTESFALYKGTTVEVEGETRIDSISSATITSRAITQAVNAALEFANGIIADQIGGIGQ